MGNPVFGVVVREVEEESRPIVGADLSTIGIVGPASGADAAEYPLDTPVKVYSNQTSKIAKLGTQGYLADALRGINDQLGTTQFAARCVVVRTAEGIDIDPAIKLQKTIAKVMGSSTAGTGVYAFLKSVSALSVAPRLIIAPGYTSQMANGLDVVTQEEAGDGYESGKSYPVTFTGGGANAVQAIAHALGNADGTLGDVILDTPGAWYDDAPSPGITATAQASGKRVTVAVVASGGTLYTENDTINLANGVQLSVTGVESGGIVTTVEILDPGRVAYNASDPTNPQAQVTSSGQGTGATFTLTWTLYTAATYSATVALGANPVCAALAGGLLAQLYGHAVVESAGTSEDNDNDWRETMNSQRLIPISGGCRVLDPDSETVVFRPLAPRIVGIGVRRDHEKGAPFHSWANQPVQGIVGPMRTITYSLSDDANEAQALLKNNIGIVVRGELGNEFAIASGGFVFIGTDNAGEDELWRFYSMRRGRDYIHLSLLRAMRYYLGRFNISVHTVQAILNAMKMLLRDLQADGHILGYKISFSPDANSSDEIRLGHLTIGFKAEEAAPLRLITVESARYREAVDAMLAELAQQLSLAA